MNERVRNVLLNAGWRDVTTCHDLYHVWRDDVSRSLAYVSQASEPFDSAIVNADSGVDLFVATNVETFVAYIIG